MTAPSTGGAVRGNDKESVDAGTCSVVWRRRPYKGAAIIETACDGRLEPVLAQNGGTCGYRCTHCKAQYTLKRQRIVTPKKGKS